MLYRNLLSAAIFLTGAYSQQATNCQYQSLKCGSALLAAPYSESSSRYQDVPHLQRLTTLMFQATPLLNSLQLSTILPQSQFSLSLRYLRLSSIARTFWAQSPEMLIALLDATPRLEHEMINASCE